MTTAAAPSGVSGRLPNLWQHFDAGEAAQQVASLATDLKCAVDGVRFVLNKLSQCHRPGKLLPLVDLLYRLSLLPSPFVAQALQRLQSEVIQALQLSVPQIPEHQQKHLDALRQRWLEAVQARSRSGQLFLQEVAEWLSGASLTSQRRVQTRDAGANAYSKHALGSSVDHADTELPPPPPRPTPHLNPSAGPSQSAVFGRSGWDASPDQPFTRSHNNQQAQHQHAAPQHSVSQLHERRQPTGPYAMQPSAQTQNASADHLTQHIQSLTLRPSSQDGQSGAHTANGHSAVQQAAQAQHGAIAVSCAASAQAAQVQHVEDPFAWVASAPLWQVKKRLGELRQVRAQLHQEERILHARRQELDPTSGRPLKVFCWCGAELEKWVLGNTYCGRARPGEPRGHKLCLTSMQCTECKCKKTIVLKGPIEDCWCPKQWQCPGCSKELHGATCSKAGSEVVVVH